MYVCMYTVGWLIINQADYQIQYLAFFWLISVDVLIGSAINSWSGSDAACSVHSSDIAIK